MGSTSSLHIIYCPLQNIIIQVQAVFLPMASLLTYEISLLQGFYFQPKAEFVGGETHLKELSHVKALQFRPLPIVH